MIFRSTRLVLALVLGAISWPADAQDELAGNYRATLSVESNTCLFQQIGGDSGGVMEASAGRGTLVLHLEELGPLFVSPIMVAINNNAFAYSGPIRLNIGPVAETNGHMTGQWSDDRNSLRAAFDVPTALCTVRGTIVAERTDTQTHPAAQATPPSTSAPIYQTPSGGAASSAGGIDASAFANLIGQEASFQASNFPDRFIRHRQSLGYAEPVPDELGRNDSTFRIQPGLAGRCISLESHNYPGQFLRHQNWRIKLAPREDNDLYRNDATFCMVAGLANSAGVSFESANNPHHFIRHRNGELWVDDFDGSGLFRADATFNVTQPGGTVMVR